MPPQRIVRTAGWLFINLAIAASAFGQWNPLNPVADVKEQDDGVLLKMQTGTLRLQICSDSIVRITYVAGATFPDGPSDVITKTAWPKTSWTMQSSDKDVSVTTPRLKLTIARKDGTILFADAGGNELFQD